MPQGRRDVADQGRQDDQRQRDASRSARLASLIGVSSNDPVNRETSGQAATSSWAATTGQSGEPRHEPGDQRDDESVTTSFCLPATFTAGAAERRRVDDHASRRATRSNFARQSEVCIAKPQTNCGDSTYVAADFGRTSSRSRSGSRTTRCKARNAQVQDHAGLPQRRCCRVHGSERLRRATAASSRSRRRRAIRRSGRSSPRPRRTGRGAGDLDPTHSRSGRRRDPRGAGARRRGSRRRPFPPRGARAASNAARASSVRSPADERLAEIDVRLDPVHDRLGRRRGSASASRVIALSPRRGALPGEDPSADVAPERLASRCRRRSRARGSGRTSRSPRSSVARARAASARGTRPPSRGRTVSPTASSASYGARSSRSAASRSPASLSMRRRLHPEPRRVHLEAELLEERPPARRRAPAHGRTRPASRRGSPARRAGFPPTAGPPPSARSPPRSARSPRRRASGRATAAAGVRRRRPPLLADVACAPRVLDRVRGRARPRHRTGTRCRPTQASRRQAIARPASSPACSKTVDRRGDLLLDACRVPARRRPCADGRAAARASRAPRPPAQPSSCRVASSSTAVASSKRPVMRSASPCSGRRRSRSGCSLGQQGRRAAEQRRRGRDVAAGERAPAGRGEAPGAVLADRAAPLVERAELGEVRPGLLEVVAEDLLELDPAVAVRHVGPRDEARRGGPPGRA